MMLISRSPQSFGFVFTKKKLRCAARTNGVALIAFPLRLGTRDAGFLSRSRACGCHDSWMTWSIPQSCGGFSLVDTEGCGVNLCQPHFRVSGGSTCAFIVFYHQGLYHKRQQCLHPHPVLTLDTQTPPLSPHFIKLHIATPSSNLGSSWNNERSPKSKVKSPPNFGT